MHVDEGLLAWLFLSLNELRGVDLRVGATQVG